VEEEALSEVGVGVAVVDIAATAMLGQDKGAAAAADYMKGVADVAGDLIEEIDWDSGVVVVGKVGLVDDANKDLLVEI